MPHVMEKFLVTAGRVLLGLYFIVPGLTKITGFQTTGEYMASHGMVFIPFFLVLTIFIQIGGGVAMLVGYQTRLVAFVLAGLTLVISLFLKGLFGPGEPCQYDRPGVLTLTIEASRRSTG